MKKTLLVISMIVASTPSLSHKFLTESAIESVEESGTFTGFEFVTIPEFGGEKYHLTGAEISTIYQKINRKRALSHFSSSPPGGGNNQGQGQSGNNQGQTGNTPNVISNNNWFKYSDVEVTTHMLYPDSEMGGGGGGHHDDGIFDPRFKKVNDVALEICSRIQEDNPDIEVDLIPYFTGPESFVETTIIDGFEIPMMKEHHETSTYDLSDGISFKCAYLSE